MAEKAREINPHVSIEIFKEGVGHHNADSFLDGANVGLDGIDFFNIKDRLTFFRRARLHKVPVISVAPIGFGASVLVFSPTGMTFEDYFDIHDDTDEKEATILFGLGLSPGLIHRSYFHPTKIDLNSKKTPSLVAGPLLCANLATSKVAKLVLEKKVKFVPHSFHFDPYVQKLKKMKLRYGNRGLIQRAKIALVKNMIDKV
jgi:molybdopterin/thiamine biosynthesis adenylyltransferase